MKKVLLYFTLALALGSLGIIVYAAKAKKWLFGKQYHSHLEKISKKVHESLQNVMGETVTDTLSLSRDGTTKKLFVAYSLGEDTRRYIADFQNKQIGMTYANKIQIVDKNGKIILSTLDREAEMKKVSRDYLGVLKDHFVIHKKRPYILFKNDKKEFIVTERFPKEGPVQDIHGYVLVYYNTQKILQSLPDINLAGTKNNQIFLTSKKYTDQEITALMNRLNTYPAGSSSKEKDFLIRMRVNGVVAAFDINSQPYRPWIAIIMIILNLALLGLVIFALSSAYNSETVPQTITPDPELMAIDHPEQVGADPISQTKAYYAHSEKYGTDNDEIRGLVDDIESGNTYNQTNGNQGIENMIMESDQDFTTMPDMISVDNYDRRFENVSKGESGLDDDFAHVDSGFEFDGIDEGQSIDVEAGAGEISADEFGLEADEGSSDSTLSEFDGIEETAAGLPGLEDIDIATGDLSIPDETPDEISEELPDLEITEELPGETSAFDFDAIQTEEVLDLNEGDTITEEFTETAVDLDTVGDLPDIEPDLSLDDEFSTVGAEDVGLAVEESVPAIDQEPVEESVYGSDEDTRELQQASFEDSTDIWDIEPEESNSEIDELEDRFDQAFEKELGLPEQDEAEVLESLETDVFEEAVEEGQGQLWESPVASDELAVAAETYASLELPEGGGEEPVEIDFMPDSTSVPDIKETSNETELFAQQDRILQGVDETPFDENGLGPVVVTEETDPSDIMDSPFDIEDSTGMETVLMEDPTAIESEVALDTEAFAQIADQAPEDEFPTLDTIENTAGLVAGDELDEISNAIDTEALVDTGVELPDFSELKTEETSASMDREQVEGVEEVINSSESDILDEELALTLDTGEDQILSVENEDPVAGEAVFTGEEVLQDGPDSVIEDISAIELDIPEELESIEIPEPEEIDEEFELSPEDVVEVEEPFVENDIPELNIGEDIPDITEMASMIENGDGDTLEGVHNLEGAEDITEGTLDIDSLVAQVPEIGAETDEDEDISLSMEELANLKVEDASPIDRELPAETEEVIVDDLISVVPEVGMDTEDEDISLSMEELSNLDISEPPAETEQAAGTDETADEDLSITGDSITDADAEAISAEEITESTLEDLDIDNLVSAIPETEQDPGDDGDISLDVNDLDILDLDENETGPAPEEVNVSDANLDEIAQGLEGAELSEIDYNDVFLEPPVKLSSISNVEEYASVAQDLAKNNLKMSKVAVYKKNDDGFSPILNDGFSSEMHFSQDDPILKRFLNNKKSIDIRGELAHTRYLSERMSRDDLAGLEELLVVPVIHDDEVQGIALFGRSKDDLEPTNFQKSELHNLGFLQEI